MRAGRQGSGRAGVVGEIAADRAQVVAFLEEELEARHRFRSDTGAVAALALDLGQQIMKHHSHIQSDCTWDPESARMARRPPRSTSAMGRPAFADASLVRRADDALGRRWPALSAAMTFRAGASAGMTRVHGRCE